LKQNVFLTIICLISFFLSNCASFVERLVIDQYRSAGMPEKIIREKEEEIREYFQDVENQKEKEEDNREYLRNVENRKSYEELLIIEYNQQVKNTISDPEILPFSKKSSIIRIDIAANMDTGKVHEQINRLDNNISSLLAERNLNIISTPSDTADEYIVDINCYFDEISYTFIKIDISIINKSKYYHSQFSIDLDNGVNNKEAFRVIDDLSQICSEKIYLLLTE
jgi:hypothetical protein